MSDMFYGCYSLSYLPDISKWYNSGKKNIFGIFYQYGRRPFGNCFSLLNIPKKL